MQFRYGRFVKTHLTISTTRASITFGIRMKFAGSGITAAVTVLFTLLCNNITEECGSTALRHLSSHGKNIGLLSEGFRVQTAPRTTNHDLKINGKIVPSV